MADYILPNYFWMGDFSDFEALLRKHGRLSEYGRGNVASGAAEVFPNACYTVAGLMKLSVLHEDGYEKTVLFSGPGSMTPLYSPPSKFKLEYEALIYSAATDAVIIEIPQQKMLQLMIENPSLHLRMTDVYVKFANLLLYDSISQARNDTLTRVADFLSIYLVSMRASVVYLSQSEIAEAIGGTRANVARAVRTLRDRGAIETFRGRLKIVDVDMLRSFCSLDTRLE